MVTGLEALKRLKSSYALTRNERMYLCERLEHVLKALEIIKKYIGVRETLDDLFPFEIIDKQYVSSGSSLVISKEEYGFLKDVLYED